MQDVMERLNLNVPRGVRKRLRAMAKQSGRTEAEVARTLLVDAVERARREEIFRQFAEAYTPERRARDLAILRAFERLDAETR
jgi:CopG antitoxin of type II toxin-antitoxin system